MLFIGGCNDFCQLGEKSNNIRKFIIPFINPPIKSRIDAKTISSYSIYGDKSIIITTDGTVLATGNNTEGQICPTTFHDLFNEYDQFQIKYDKLQYIPISAVCGCDFTVFIVSCPQKSNIKCLAYFCPENDRKDSFILNIGNSIPLSLFGGCKNAVMVDSEGFILFIPMSVRKSLTSELDKSFLTDNEKPVSIACCNDYIFAVGMSGRTFFSETRNNKLEFKEVEELKGIKIIEVSGIFEHCLAVTEDGRVFGRGSNKDGQIGIGESIENSNKFIEIKALNIYRYKHVYAGKSHSLFQTKNGIVLACGRNCFGELLSERPCEKIFYLPIKTLILDGVTFCVAGDRTSSVFIGADPLNSPNRPIDKEKFSEKTYKIFRPQRPNNNPRNIFKRKNLKVKISLSSSSSDNDSNDSDSLTEKDLEKEENTPQKKLPLLHLPFIESKRENNSQAVKANKYHSSDSNLKLARMNCKIDLVSPQNFSFYPNLSTPTLESTSQDLKTPTLESNNTDQQLNNDFNYFIEEDEFFENVGQIGEGSTSITYKIIDKRNNVPMCKKVFKYKKHDASIKDAQNALKEFHVLYYLSHPCICKAIGINIAEPIEIINEEEELEEVTTIAIFLEFIKHNLSDVLKKKIDNTKKAIIVLEIVHAMKFLHKNGIMHRDLKIENIMLGNSYETKIVDFGLVKINESFFSNFSCVQDSLTKGIGTLAYMSPEMLNEEDYDNKTDVYSFGVVLYFIFIGQLPKQNMKDKLNGKEIVLPPQSESISPFCINLIKQCMSYSPLKRPSFDEVLNMLRSNSYNLASGIDISVLSERDKELDVY